MASLKFAAWTSDVELAFYASLANLKINHDKLDDSARKCIGLYEVRPNDPPERSCRIQIHGNALTTDDTSAPYYRAEGIFKNVNTIEEYKKLDRTAVCERAGKMIWDAIKDGSIYSCPSLLSSFSAISFADLKKYKFTYHFCFPALHSDPPWQLAEAKQGSEVKTKLDAIETTHLVDAVQTWRYRQDTRQHGFFLAKRVWDSYPDVKPQEEDQQPPKTPVTPHQEFLGFKWVVGALGDFENEFFKGIPPSDRFICFADPSTYASHPGWPLRNLLVLLRQRWQLEEAQILCYRDTHSRRDQVNSIILNIKSGAPTTGLEQKTSPFPKVTGWERTEAGKLTSRTVDLAEYMDPQRLADQAVDLNLKLIKWRIAPSLDLDVIKNTKCLLLGAGTLGSYVSRNLMGWGVRKITFVDNATVSFSNPVRQPLFEFKDCLGGGAKKATRAAEALKTIYPGVESEGHVMSVPMAGHPITDEVKVKGDFEKLQKLIEEHDAIFLLMDTRESRWLPTVMAKAAGKIVLNAALGFDTFVVMRHGLKPVKEGQGEEVGCYFCNDVVAPADSLKDATLDQQCTVTRPGIAPIASALLVELLVSILQHPLKACAPPAAPNSSQSSSNQTAFSENDFDHPLGTTPHQLRGFLSNFNTLSINGKPYDCCSACSDGILTRYHEDGWEFVKKAINEKGWVEDISGLAEVHRKAEAAMEAEEWDVSDNGDEGEGELI